MENKILELNQILAWKPLLQRIKKALSEPSSLYLNIWGYRGAGKTMFLELLVYNLKGIPNILLFNPQDAEKIPYDIMRSDILSYLEKTKSKSQKKLILIDHLDSLSKAEKNDFEDILIRIINKKIF